MKVSQRQIGFAFFDDYRVKPVESISTESRVAAEAA
jgi:hypothetical protein